MNPIHDSSGAVVAWLDSQYIRDLNGGVIAFVRYINVYRLDGQNLGTFRSCYFRDHSGFAVAFVRGATIGPLLPFPAIPPVPPIPAVPPSLPFPAIPPPIPASPLPEWSPSGWDAFIFG